MYVENIHNLLPTDYSVGLNLSSRLVMHFRIISYSEGKMFWKLFKLSYD